MECSMRTSSNPSLLHSSSRLLPYRGYIPTCFASRPLSRILGARALLVQCSLGVNHQSHPELKPCWGQRLLKAARVFFGIIAVFVACDVLHFLGGSRPPTGEASWRSLAVRDEDEQPQNAAKRREPIVIYDRHKRIIAQFSSSTIIPLSEVPDHVWQSVVSSEDRSFFHHPGLDVKGLARAVLFAGRRGGGSTITQQLVKNLFVSDSKTISRKVFEMAIALALEVHSSKTRILETYLQTAYFGHGAFGVAHAASTYFQKDASHLTVNEAALLAATLPSPETLSPLRDRSGAAKRLEKVLRSMHLMGYLSEPQLHKALLEGLPASLATSPQPAKGPSLPQYLVGAPSRAPFFVARVMKQLQEITDGRTLQGGMHVYTTADLRLQEHAERVLRSDGLMQPPGAMVGEAALVAVEPGSGAVRVLVGGRDYTKSQYDRAAHACRPCASVFKPAVFLAALEHRLITPSSLLPDQPLNYARRAPKAPQRSPLSFLASPFTQIRASNTQHPASGTTSQSQSGGATGKPAVESTSPNHPSPPGRSSGQPEQSANQDDQQSTRSAVVGPSPQLGGAPNVAVSLTEPERGGEWVCTSTACPLSDVSPPLSPPRRRRQYHRSHPSEFFQAAPGDQYDVMRLSAKYRRQMRQALNSRRAHASSFRSLASISHAVSRVLERLEGSGNYERIETRLIAAQEKAHRARARATRVRGRGHVPVPTKAVQVPAWHSGPVRSFYSFQEPVVPHDSPPSYPHHSQPESNARLGVSSTNQQPDLDDVASAVQHQNGAAGPEAPQVHHASPHLRTTQTFAASGRAIGEEIWERVGGHAANKGPKVSRGAASRARHIGEDQRAGAVDVSQGPLGQRASERSGAAQRGEFTGHGALPSNYVGREPSGAAEMHMHADGVHAAPRSASTRDRASGTKAAPAAQHSTPHETVHRSGRGSSKPRESRKREGQTWQHVGVSKVTHSRRTSRRRADDTQHASHRLHSHPVSLVPGPDSSSSSPNPAQDLTRQHQGSQKQEVQAESSGLQHSRSSSSSQEHGASKLFGWRRWRPQHARDQAAQPTAGSAVRPDESGIDHMAELSSRAPHISGTEDNGAPGTPQQNWKATMHRSSLTVLPQHPEAAASSRRSKSATVKESVEYEVVEEYLPTNVTSQFAGVVTAQTALVHSLNAPAVALAYEVGLENVRGCAEALGLPMPHAPTLSMALGTSCASPLQVAAAYAAVAARGVAAEPYLVRLVKDSQGATIFRHRNKSRRVARKDSCDQLTSMLGEAYRSGTAAAARRWCPKVAAAAKTGTSDGCRDGWLAGYTGSLATVVWVGRDDNGSLAGTAARVAAPVWGRFMAGT